MEIAFRCARAAPTKWVDRQRGFAKSQAGSELCGHDEKESSEDAIATPDENGIAKDVA